MAEGLVLHEARFWTSQENTRKTAPTTTSAQKDQDSELLNHN